MFINIIKDELLFLGNPGVFPLALVASLAFLAKRHATVCLMGHICFHE